MIFSVSNELKSKLALSFPMSIFLNSLEDFYLAQKEVINSKKLLVVEFNSIQDLIFIKNIKKAHPSLQVILYYQKGDVSLTTLLNSSITLPFLKSAGDSAFIKYLLSLQSLKNTSKNLNLNEYNRSLEKGLKTVKLSSMEFNLLSLLIERKGRVVQRETIMDEIWSYNSMASTKTLDVHIYKLRKILKQEFDLDPIVTYPKLGYMFTTTN